ncbi:MAG: FAD-dependent oxidoreductase [Candidatus Latescibacterota bacterium]
MEDALDIRRRIFSAFERAEAEPDTHRRAPWLRFVVIGGGPTGVELAGAIAELKSSTLHGEFRAFDSREAEVILLEGSDRVLPPYPESLSWRARVSLEKLGVQVRTQAIVRRIEEGTVVIEQDGAEEVITAQTVLWAAGMRTRSLADRLARATGAVQDRQGRIVVNDHLNPERALFHLRRRRHGAPRAGRQAPARDRSPSPCSRAVMWRARSASACRVARPFLSATSTTGRWRSSVGTPPCVTAICPLRRLVAWALWLLVHIAYLIEYDNRLRVLAEWAWSYFTRKRGAWLITGEDPKRT